MSYKIYDIKTNIKEILKEVSIGFIWLRAGPVVGYFKHGNEQSYFITYREFLDDDYVSNSDRFIKLNYYSGTKFFLLRCGPERAMVSSFLRSLNHTQRRNTVDMTPLDERSAGRRNLYLTTHNTHNRETFEHTISAGEQRQTCALARETIETSGQ
jgi:GR25 family glycosyltransferase involved in LPS biosynthesis